MTESDGHRRRVLLTDFGIARRIDDVSNLTDDGVAVGTVSYIAPEQLLNKPLDGRADQYALAATTFHLLTGATTVSGLEPRRGHQPPSEYTATADIGPPTRSRASRRRAGQGTRQRPRPAIPELPRLARALTRGDRTTMPTRDDGIAPAAHRIRRPPGHDASRALVVHAHGARRAAQRGRRSRSGRDRVVPRRAR